MKSLDVTDIVVVSPADLSDYVELWNSTWPTLSVSSSQLERDDQTLPPEMREKRWIARVAGEIVGNAEAHRPASSYHPRQWQLNVCVRPSYRKRGIGSALYDLALSHTLAEGMEHVDAIVREDDPDSIAFSNRRGFAESRRDFESTLDLHSIDKAAMQAMVERGEAMVRIRPFSELDSPTFRHQFHEMLEIVRQDVPRTEPPVPLTFDFFQQQVLDDPDMLADGWFFALDGDRIVGFSGIYRGTTEGWLDQWLTGVLPEYRGRGIAMAIKAKVILWGKAEGFTTLRTDNSSLNTPMLAVNDRCGFVRNGAILTVRKHSEPSQES